MTTPHRQNVPRIIYRDDRNRLRLVAGILSGIACMALVPVLHRLAVFTSDSLFGPVTAQPTCEKGRALGCQIAREMISCDLAREIVLQRWIGGLLVAFVGGLALFLSGKIRSRRKLSVKQYWAVTLLLVAFALASPFLLRSLG